MSSIKGFKWIRPFLPERWVDGDTAIGMFDRGDGDFYRPLKGIRLLYATGDRWDAPEMKAEPLRATQARDCAAMLCPVGVWVVSTSHTLDVYGRPLCSLQLAPGKDLALEMFIRGFSKETA